MKMSEVIQKKRKREKEVEQKKKCRKDPEFLEKERKRESNERSLRSMIYTISLPSFFSPPTCRMV